MIDLAEVVYNLQSVCGFHECIAKMRNGEIEGPYAELDLGRMLFLNRVPFKFVARQGVKGKDYDLEVEYSDGLVACAEAKCAIESATLSENAVKNKLDAARKQLPSLRPGIIFVKSPQGWMEDQRFLAFLDAATKAFFNGTKRIASVKFYASPLSVDGGDVKQRHAYKEMSNPHNRFDTKRNWNLFRQFDFPPECRGMPAHWQRL